MDTPRHWYAVATGFLIAAAGCAPAAGKYSDLVVRTAAGAETIVPATLERAYLATERAFLFLEIKRTSYSLSEDGGLRELVGRAEGRDARYRVRLERTPAGNAHIVVEASSASANPDLDLAAELTEKIIEYVARMKEGSATQPA